MSAERATACLPPDELPPIAGVFARMERSHSPPFTTPISTSAATPTTRVVSASFLQGVGGELRLREELHHNRIELVSSQIGGVATRLAHRWDRTRLERT